MNWGIKGKIVIMNIFILIIAILSIYVVTIYTLYSRVINNSIDMLRKESYTSQSFIMKYLETEDDFHVENVLNEMSPFIATYLSNNCKFRVQIYNNSSLIGDSDNYPNISKDDDVVTALKGNKSYIIRRIEESSYILFSSPIYYSDGTIGCIRYVYDLNNENTIITNTILSMVLFAIVAIIFSSMMSNSFSNRIVRPIVSLKNIARKVSFGDFSKKISINSKDEIEDLSNSFNIMSNNIEIMIENLKDEKETQKRFLDNVTHEFKTPLAAILGYSDLLLRVKEKKDIEQCVKYIVQSSNRLLKLVEQLLDLSRLNKNELEVKNENVDIKSIIETAAMMLNPRMNKFGIKLNMNLISKSVYADKEKTEQVILNLLDNAIKYSECTEIDIYMENNEDYAIIYIADNGQGIPKEDLKNVFENFYTAHKALQKKYGGSGLGLAICKEFMEKQSGKIEISSLNGTTVKLSFKHAISN
ncbi:HAMP domain-containing histidine kinase [Clostridium botulinum]|uniref:sensor histidine kinase n=1 Tax=Clostridium botulinum TaxID=1491 RepID=UPI0001AAD588|nr:HAMP domain-containing sensor histidine kinase [Clostridium botulinum]EES48058.1 two-component sensor histidine kinase [Clostridium botulinum E1 str. 'BoNT E Beluga']MBY6762874.1 HAMP domain-containing histidine kinase [Clostridium botulinum]MBY6921756.1 HAMP domain-containing histidine kinase [Clostridium botulinum]MCR1132778.1 HAMP domain-containing histidine kinase [Clostridium botulinum]NFH69932.1 HAMP domain-containing histidine kinase [Clostridium botulinum]